MPVSITTCSVETDWHGRRLLKLITPDPIIGEQRPVTAKARQSRYVLRRFALYSLWTSAAGMHRRHQRTSRPSEKLKAVLETAEHLGCCISRKRASLERASSFRPARAMRTVERPCTREVFHGGDHFLPSRHKRLHVNKGCSPNPRSASGNHAPAAPPAPFVYSQ